MIMSSTCLTVRRAVSTSKRARASANGIPLAKCQTRVPPDSPNAHIRYVTSISAPITAWPARSPPGRYQRMTGRCVTALAPRLVSSVYRLATATPDRKSVV